MSSARKAGVSPVTTIIMKRAEPLERYRVSALSFVIPSGFEPETHSLEGCCSIQLSYGTNLLL